MWFVEPTFEKLKARDPNNTIESSFADFESDELITVKTKGFPFGMELTPTADRLLSHVRNFSMLAAAHADCFLEGVDPDLPKLQKAASKSMATINPIKIAWRFSLLCIVRIVNRDDLGHWHIPQSYIQRKGMPESVNDIMNHDIIGYDRSTHIIDGFKNFGLTVKRDFFVFRCDNQIVCWRMVVAGFGIGFNQTRIGESEPNVVPITLASGAGTMPIWLTAHSDLKNSARVRCVYDYLADAIARIVG